MFFADAGDIANASNATKKFLHTFKCLELINCCLDLCDLFTVFSLYFHCITAAMCLIFIIYLIICFQIYILRMNIANYFSFFNIVW